MKHHALSAVMSFVALAALAVGPSAAPVRPAVALDSVGTTSGSREIVFVDARVADFRRLIGDREDRGQGNRQIENVVLAPGDDGLQRIGATLRHGNSANSDNAQLDLGADRIWALVFTIQMQ